MDADFRSKDKHMHDHNIMQYDGSLEFLLDADDPYSLNASLDPEYLFS